MNDWSAILASVSKRFRGGDGIFFAGKVMRLDRSFQDSDENAAFKD
jgi:hypothetical protein